jgi:cardiolipin synthase
LKETPRWLNAANLLTLARLAAVPFAVDAILTRRHERALAIVLAAGLTDVADGTLARHFGMATQTGAYLDPVVDKIFLSAVYICLAVISSIPWWLVAEIFARDFLILALSGAAMAFLRWRRFPPSVWGKASTFLQIFCALIVMIGNAEPQSIARRFGGALIWPVAALTAVSGLHYFWRGLREFRGRFFLRSNPN